MPKVRRSRRVHREVPKLKKAPLNNELELEHKIKSYGIRDFSVVLESIPHSPSDIRSITPENGNRSVSPEEEQTPELPVKVPKYVFKKFTYTSNENNSEIRCLYCNCGKEPPIPFRNTKETVTEAQLENLIENLDIASFSLTNYVIIGQCGHIYVPHYDQEILATDFFIKGTLIVHESNGTWLLVENFEIGLVGTLEDDISMRTIILKSNVRNYELMRPNPLSKNIQNVTERFFIAKTILEKLKAMIGRVTLDQLLSLIDNSKITDSLNISRAVQMHSSYLIRKIEEFDLKNDTKLIEHECINTLRLLSQNDNVYLDEIFEPMNATCTSLVGNIFEKLFPGLIQGVKIETKKEENVIKSIKSIPVIRKPVPSITRNNRIYQDKFGSFAVGDFVVFQCNGSSESKQIGKIICIYTMKIEQKVALHIRCFIKSSDTILGELGDEREIFMINRCREIPVENVMNKLQVVESETPSDTKYYCSKIYNENDLSFKTIVDKQDNIDSCNYCLKNKKEWMSHIPVNCKSYVMWKNVKYSVGMGVFLTPDAFEFRNVFEESDEIKFEEYDSNVHTEYHRKLYCMELKDLKKIPSFAVGCINRIFPSRPDPNDIIIEVKVMMRPELVLENVNNCDRNMVFWTDELRIIKFSQVIAPCHLTYKKSLKPNSFYFTSAYDCKTKNIHKVPPEAKKIICSRESAKKHSPLKSLDLFAGCGGLSKGLEQSGFAECKWAVEIESTAANAFQKNFPNCKVFAQDVNQFLLDVSGGKGMPLPRQDEVEVICCGPPCQGFSVLNRFQSNEKSWRNNSLILPTMSCVDYFRPKYFIMENVASLMWHQKGLLIMTIFKILLSMGYQCSLRILQAGGFGVPQSRRRIFVIAAASDQPLPDFPQQTHSFRSPASMNIIIDGKNYGNNFTNLSAPKMALNVFEAISDLPPIQNGQNKDPIEYDADAVTEYQQIARKNSKNLYNHVITQLGPLNMERVKRIPKLPGADWRYLPNKRIKLSDGTYTNVLQYNYKNKGVCRCADGQKCNDDDKQPNTLIPWFLPHTAQNHGHWVGVIGRIDWNDHLNTILTEPRILGTQGRVVHPLQDRVISVRECARCQGFADTHILEGEIRDMYRQVGNAVPPPLALSLGLEFIKVLSDCK